MEGRDESAGRLSARVALAGLRGDISRYLFEEKSLMETIWLGYFLICGKSIIRWNSWVQSENEG